MKVTYYDEFAEQMILGSCIRSLDCLNQCVDLLVAEDFASPLHQQMFSALRLFRSQAYTPSVEMLVSKLPAIYTVQIYDIFNMSSSADIKYYLDILCDKSQRRRLAALLNSTTQACQSEEVLTKNLLQKAAYDFSHIEIKDEVKIWDIADVIDGKNREDKRSMLTVIEANMLTASNGETVMPGIATGMTLLDDAMGGLVPGHLIIVGARPGEGKTSLAANLSHYIAMKLNHQVGFFSIEASEEELTRKILSLESNVPYKMVESGDLIPSCHNAVKTALEALRSRNAIHIDSSPQIDINTLKSRARRLVQVLGCKVIFIDYLGYISTTQFQGNKVEQISFISRELKSIAKELKVPVVCLCQLNRLSSTEKREPVQSDLRDSGQIEANADEILLLHRENPTGRNMRIIMAKNRFGPREKIECVFDGPTGKIKTTDIAVQDAFTKKTALWD